MEKYRIRINDEVVNLDSPVFWKRLEKSRRRILGNIKPWKHCKTSCQLHEWAISEMGQIMYYMQYIYPKVDWGNQKERIEKMYKVYADRSDKHLENTKKNRLWLKKFIFKFLDLTENMC